jgi:hypothetical protein
MILTKHRHIFSYLGKSAMICQTIWSRFAIPKPKHATPFVYHILMYYSNYCEEKYALDLILDSYSPSPAKKPISDLKYLKKLKEDSNSIGTALQKILVDCSNTDNAAKIFQEILILLHAHSKEPAIQFSRRIELFCHVLCRTQECGLFMEDAIHAYLLANFVHPLQRSKSLNYEPWLVQFILELVLKQCYCIKKLIDHIFMPIFGLLKSDFSRIDLIGDWLSDWLIILDTVLNFQFNTKVKVCIYIDIGNYFRPGHFIY